VTTDPARPTPQDYLDAAKAWVDVTGGEVWPGSHRHTAQRPELRAAVDSAFAAGWRARVPEGSEEREEWGTRMWMAADPVNFEDSDPPLGKDRAETRVAFHQRKQREEPGWRGRCVLIRRRVITTPWQVPDA
jgi:hypothetical protein